MEFGRSGFSGTLDFILCNISVTLKPSDVMTLIAALLVLEIVFATTSFIVKHHRK
jgi:hypothetical protein